MTDLGQSLFGKDDLVADLQALGLRAGDGVFVHCALGKVGHVIGGPRGVILALMDVVGPEGLIGMPGFCRDAYDPVAIFDLDVPAEMHARIKDQVLGFDADRSDVRQNGSVPEAFRTWPGVVRSPHPTSSVLLWGAEAGNLSVPHDVHGWATGTATPWGRLRTRPKMKILLIGVGWNRCSALHAAETISLHKRSKTRHFKLGNLQTGVWIDAPDVADDLDTLFPLVGAAWEAEGQVTSGQIGKAQAMLTDYGAVVSFAADWLNARNKRDGVPPTDLAMH